MKKFGVVDMTANCVTDFPGSYIHRFYDTSPISPSGHFIVVTKFPYENQRPVPGDEAEVQVVEISSNKIVFSFKTKAWDTQLGCQAQWGTSDSVLLFNAMGDNWIPHGIKANIFSKEIINLDFTVYMASNNGEYVLSPNLMKIGQVRLGYGIRTPFDNERKHAGAPEDDGLFITSVVDGSTSLLLPLSKLYKLFLNGNPKYDTEKGSLYGFHAKWSPNDQKIMFIARWKFEGEKHTDNFLFTLDSDGTNIKLAITPARWKGGIILIGVMIVNTLS